MTDTAEDLSWLVYTSFAADDFDEQRLGDLLQQSRTDNAARAVTGLLLFKDQRFLQALEGPADVVSSLMDTIARDLRHIDVYVLLEEPLAERHFPSWAMGYQTWSHASSAWPSDNIDAFRELTDGPPSDGVRSAVRELFTWFEERTGSDAASAGTFSPADAEDGGSETTAGETRA